MRALMREVLRLTSNIDVRHAAGDRRRRTFLILVLISLVYFLLYSRLRAFTRCDLVIAPPMETACRCGAVQDIDSAPEGETKALAVASSPR